MRSRHILLCCLISLCLAVPFHAAAEPSLVRDFHQGLSDEVSSVSIGEAWNGAREGSVLIRDFGNWPTRLLPLPDALLIVTSDSPRHELWRTRGTPETTEKIVDLATTGQVGIGPWPLSGGRSDLLCLRKASPGGALAH